MLRYLLVITASLFFLANTALAYNPNSTHAALSDEIVDFYNLLHPESPLTPEEKEWIVEGSILEDREVRALNHLYDPVHKIGWTAEKIGLHNKKLDKAYADAIESVAGALVAPAEPTDAVRWVNDRILQSRYGSYGGDRTWRQALEYWAEGSKKEAYITMGHAIHLLEDMSVPDHTRNDPHPPFGEALNSPFEEYTQKWIRGNISNLNVPKSLKDNGTIPTAFNSIEDYLRAMADYSNKYFFSRDTINDPDYELPKIIREDANFGYGIDEDGVEFPLVMVDLKTNENRETTKELSLKKEKEYHPILDAYFSRLAPKAVFYGAGVIELFHKQAEDALINKDFPVRLVKLDKSSGVVRFFTNSFSPIGEAMRMVNGAKSFFANTGDALEDFLVSFFGGKDEVGFSNEAASEISESPAIQKTSEINNNETPLDLATIQNKLDDAFDRAKEIDALLELENPPPIISVNNNAPTVRQASNSTVPTQSPVDGLTTGGSATPENGSSADTAGNNNSNTSNASGNNDSDDGGALPAATPTPPDTVSNVSHVLISELQVSGVDAGDEFLELYNPTDVAIDISGWSVQYVSGSASEISAATVSRKNLENGNAVRARGFFLIARSLNSSGADGYSSSTALTARGSVTADMSHRTFSLSGALAGAKIFIVSNQEDVDSLNDPDVVDFLDYSPNVPGSGESIERKAYNNSACVEAVNDNEFSGNGCDTDENDNFILRANSNPQNTSSLAEPREAPAVTGLAGAYSEESFQIDLSWSGVLNTPAYKIERRDGENAILVGVSSEPQFSFSPDEVGVDYELGVRAVDAEGMVGPAATTAVSVPGFLSQVDFYANPASSSAEYLVDISFDEFPFVPDLFWSTPDTTWKAVIIYLNSEPALQELLQNTNSWESDSSDALAVKYESCAGSFSAKTGILIADTVSGCGSGGGLMNAALDFDRIEDNRVRLVLASSTSDLALDAGDYLTFAFYSFYQSGGGQQTLKLVAVDKTKNYFSETLPASLAPEVPGDLAASYDLSSAKIIFSWLPPEDQDSPDGLITYSYRVNGGEWQAAIIEPGSDPARRYSSFSASPNMDYSIDLVANDDRGNVSPPASVSITTPAQPVPFGVSNMRWGYINNPSLLELSFDFNEYPFISSGGYPWYAMIFYLNQDPPSAHSFNLEADDATIVSSNTVLEVDYPSCDSSSEKDIGLFMSDPSLGLALCNRRHVLRREAPQFVFSSSSLPGIIITKVQPGTFSASDYITVGFYNTDSFGYPAGTFNLVARDLNRYYFSE